MKSAVETLSPTRVKLTVEVPFDDLKPSLDAAYKRIATQVSIPGFRKGKVPQRIIDQRVGRAAVLDEALNEALGRAYEDAVREQAIVVLGQPDVDISQFEDGQDLTFTAEVDVRPEFDLPDYNGLEVQVDANAVSDADVDEQLDALRARFGTLVVEERASINGDVLLVDIAGTHEGADVEDLQATALSYELGTDNLIPGFDEAVVGASAGETRNFDFTPEVGEWADKVIDVLVTVVSVRRRDLPTADDDFAQMASEFDTIDELRSDLRTRLERVRTMEQGYEAREKVHAKLIEVADVPVPEKVVEQQVEQHFGDGHGDDAHREEFLETTRKGLVSQFILDKIADTEQLAVSNEEMTTWLVAEAPRYGVSPDEFINELMQAGQLPSAVAEVRRAKALALVLENAKVTDAAGTVINLSSLDPQMGVREPVFGDNALPDELDDSLYEDSEDFPGHFDEADKDDDNHDSDKDDENAEV